jgi:hypothetical protein
MQLGSVGMMTLPQYESFKEYIVFLIDAGSSMFTRSDGDSKSCFGTAIDCALVLSRNK